MTHRGSDPSQLLLHNLTPFYSLLKNIYRNANGPFQREIFPSFQSSFYYTIPILNIKRQLDGAGVLVGLIEYL